MGWLEDENGRQGGKEDIKGGENKIKWKWKARLWAFRQAVGRYRTKQLIHIAELTGLS